MDGLLCVLKPVGMTSFDVVSLIRRWTGTRRVGHAGTLDPDAAGVLVVCVGKATRAVDFLMEKDKEYRVELCLGIETDTQDASGKVLRSVVPDMADERICQTVRGMAGSHMQTPPMYSALKVDGKRLYELAREGRIIERACRPVVISRCEPLSISREADRTRVLLDVTCSKGTYMRTLCHDIGVLLGCGGHMSFLLRIRTGAFRLEDSVALESLALAAADGTVGQCLAPIDSAFAGIPSVAADPDASARLMNGQVVPISLLKEICMANEEGAGSPDIMTSALDKVGKREADYYRVYTGSRFLGLGRSETIPGTVPVAGFRLFRQLRDG
jgi:tRNA pseudouridine55 synthase